jgi:hypothetical protein
MATYGLRVAPSPFECSPYDLLAEHAGKIIKVQVKSTATVSRENSYQFSMGTKSYFGDVDLIAYVAMDRKLVCYRRPEKIKARSNRHWMSASTMQRYGSSDLFEIFTRLHQDFTEGKQ